MESFSNSRLKDFVSPMMIKIAPMIVSVLFILKTKKKFTIS